MLRRHTGWRWQFALALVFGLGLWLGPARNVVAAKPLIDLGWSSPLTLGTPADDAPSTKAAAKATASTTSSTAGRNPAYPSISGFAYVDANHNGKKDKGEWAVANARMVLKPKKYEKDPHYWLTTLTSADGSYYFDVRKTDEHWFLGPGVYSVWEMQQPAGCRDGLDQSGTVVNSAGKLVDGKGNPATGTKSFGAPANTRKMYDAITGIQVPANGRARNFNFGESVTSSYLSKRMFLSVSSSAVTVKPYADPTLAHPPAPPPVPEPGTLALVLTAGAGVAAVVWGRRGKRPA